MYKSYMVKFRKDRFGFDSSVSSSLWVEDLDSDLPYSGRDQRFGKDLKGKPSEIDLSFVKIRPTDKMPVFGWREELAGAELRCSSALLRSVS